MTTSHYRGDFIERLGFGLDPFQVAALDAFDDGGNVLVSAPTGSGKTLIANYAIGELLARQYRTFYTTPLKALSNQKYHELGRLYGPERVGLLTGDTSVNRDAEVVVMTTEVLRNMLLTDSDQLAGLGLVVLDEVHYLQDPFRGGVWEEVLILTPPGVRFVALSATIGNPEFLGEWISSVRGPTHVISEMARPIQLHHHVAVVRRGQAGAELHDLLDGGRLADEARRIDSLTKNARRFRGRQWHGPRDSAPPQPFRLPHRSELLRLLDDEDLLPVIVFIFSRAACDDAVHQLRRDGLIFTTPEQRRVIERIADEHVASYSDDELQALEYPEFLDALRRGITMHHAGMVPAFREIVEACFENNLLAAVFATETLALGVNMPARTVALERFTKYSDAGRQMLTSAEYSQMTGRAGRRGLDDEGHAVVCFATDLSLQDVGRVALAPPRDLHSSFRPTYNFTANLIANFDETTAHNIVRRSFAQYEFDRRPSGPGRSLVELLQSRQSVLDDLGYTEGWRLTPAGELLRSIYHECDLALAQAILQGAFDGLGPATLAGVLSAFVYESKRAARPAPGLRRAPVQPARRPKPLDRLGRERRDEIAERLREVHLAVATVQEVEGRHQVPLTRDADGHFATVIANWARGAALGPTLSLADLEVGLTSPGDFVRIAKQVADLCEQVSLVTHRPDLAASALEARQAVVRSVVATVVSVHPREGEPL